MLGAKIGVEEGESRVRIERQRDPQPRLLIDPQHSRVLGLRQDGIPPHITIVLVGDPGLVGDIAVRQYLQPRIPQAFRGVVARQAFGAIAIDLVKPGRTMVWAIVGRPLVGHSPRVHVHDAVAVPVDDEPLAVGDLADDGGRYIPLAADLHETLHVPGLHHGHHAFLRLAHQDLLGSEVRVAQRDEVEIDRHAAVACGGQLGGGAGDARGPEVLDAIDDTRLEQLEGALDEQLLHERVADLHAGPLRRAGLVKGLGGQDRGSSDPVAASRRAEEDHPVAHPGGVGAVQVLVAQHPDTQRVDERVAQIGGVELHLAADVWQAQAVAVPADSRDDTR